MYIKYIYLDNFKIKTLRVLINECVNLSTSHKVNVANKPEFGSLSLLKGTRYRKNATYRLYNPDKSQLCTGRVKGCVDFNLCVGIFVV